MHMTLKPCTIILLVHLLKYNFTNHNLRETVLICCSYIRGCEIRCLGDLSLALPPSSPFTEKEKYINIDTPGSSCQRASSSGSYFLRWIWKIKFPGCWRYPISSGLNWTSSPHSKVYYFQNSRGHLEERQIFYLKKSFQVKSSVDTNPILISR